MAPSARTGRLAKMSANWDILSSCYATRAVRANKGLLTLPQADGVARENPPRQDGARRVWRFQAQGRQRSMGGFSPQPEGTGPIFPISSLLVVSVTGYSALLAPRTEKNWLPSPPSEVVLTGPRFNHLTKLSVINVIYITSYTNRSDFDNHLPQWGVVGLTLASISLVSFGWISLRRERHVLVGLCFFIVGFILWIHCIGVWANSGFFPRLFPR